jgi:hypothetical protein
MPRQQLRNAFISFHIQDEAQVNLLRAQAKSERFALDFRDYSIKEPFDSQWKEQCRERIARTSITICMIGEKTHERPAVSWELETSYELGHKVIGVRIYADKNHPLPATLVSRQAQILPWNLGAIVRELELESVECRSATTTTGRACRNRTLTQPCWMHQVRPQSQPVPPYTTAVQMPSLIDAFSTLLKKLLS